MVCESQLPPPASRPGPAQRDVQARQPTACDTGPVPEPATVIPMSTTDILPQGLQEGRVVNRSTILTSRGHPNPGSARDGLAEWAQQNNFDAVVGVRLVATPEILLPGEVTTEVKWAAYGTAIGW
jgi:hypothetical protein